MSLKIRQVELEDAPPLAELLRSIDLYPPTESVAETVRRVFAQLKLCLADASHTIYVAETDEGDIAGYIAAHWLPYLILPGPEGFVSELFIEKSRRGQGTGSQLLAAILAEAQARGCARLQLINFKDRDSYLRGFYAKAGWEERADAANFVFTLNRQ